MLTPYSPLDFIEALARERSEAIRADADRIHIARRIVNALAAASRLVRARRIRAIPKPA